MVVQDLKRHPAIQDWLISINVLGLKASMIVQVIVQTIQKQCLETQSRLLNL